MAAQLRITPEALRDIELQIRNLVAEQEALSAKTRSILDALNSSWQSDTVEAAVYKMRSLLANDSMKNEVLTALATQASEASRMMEECDASIANIASAFEG